MALGWCRRASIETTVQQSIKHAKDVIQATTDVLAGLAPSRVKPAPTVDLCTPDLWEQACLRSSA
ncbi:conserved hypothetical protein [Pseudomonas donghuensis]